MWRDFYSKKVICTKQTKHHKYQYVSYPNLTLAGISQYTLCNICQPEKWGYLLIITKIAYEWLKDTGESSLQYDYASNVFEIVVFLYSIWLMKRTVILCESENNLELMKWKKKLCSSCFLWMCVVSSVCMMHYVTRNVYVLEEDRTRRQNRQASQQHMNTQQHNESTHVLSAYFGFALCEGGW